MAITDVLSYYLENALLNHLLKNTPYTPSATIYLALYLANPTKNDLPVQEVSGDGYSRYTCPAFTISASGAYNSTEIDFDEATASWGNVAYMALRDDSDNLLFFGDLDSIINPTATKVVRTDPYLAVNLSGTTDMGWGEGVSASLLNLVLNNGSYPSGSALYLAIGRSVTYNGSFNLTNWAEVGAADYSRQMISASSWGTVSGGETILGEEVIFTESAQINWGTISHMVLYDEPTSGSPIFWGKLADSYLIGIGDGLKFLNGGIVVRAHLPTAPLPT